MASTYEPKSLYDCKHQALLKLCGIAIAPIILGIAFPYATLPIAFTVISMLSFFRLGLASGVVLNIANFSWRQLNLSATIRRIVLTFLVSIAILHFLSMMNQWAVKQQGSQLTPEAAVTLFRKWEDGYVNGGPLLLWRAARPQPYFSLIKDSLPGDVGAIDEFEVTFEPTSFAWSIKHDPIFRIPIVMCAALALSTMTLGLLALQRNQINRSGCQHFSLDAFWISLLSLSSVEIVYGRSFLAIGAAAISAFIMFRWGALSANNEKKLASPAGGKENITAYDYVWRFISINLLLCVLLEVLISSKGREFLAAPLGLMMLLSPWPAEKSLPTLNLKRLSFLLLPLIYLIIRLWLSRSLINNSWFFLRGTIAEHTTACLTYTLIAAILIFPKALRQAASHPTSKTAAMLMALGLFAISGSLYRFPYYVILFFAAYFIAIMKGSAFAVLRPSWKILWVIPALTLVDYLRKIPWSSVHFDISSLRMLCDIRPGDWFLFGGGPNPLAIWLLIFLAVGFVMARLAKEKREQAINWSIFWLSVAALLVTQSRGALLGAVVMAIFAIVTSNWVRSSTWRLLTTCIASFCAVGGLCVLFGGIEIASIEDRARLGRFAWSVFLSHPWLGVGIFGYREAAIPAAAMLRMGGVPDHCHNLFLELLISHGIVGLSVIIITAGFIINDLVRSIPTMCQEDRVLVKAAILAFIGTCIHGLFDPTWLMPEFLASMPIIIGLLLGAKRVSINMTAVQPQADRFFRAQDTTRKGHYFIEQT